MNALEWWSVVTAVVAGIALTKAAEAAWDYVVLPLLGALGSGVSRLIDHMTRR